MKYYRPCKSCNHPKMDECPSMTYGIRLYVCPKCKRIDRIGTAISCDFKPSFESIQRQYHGA